MVLNSSCGGCNRAQSDSLDGKLKTAPAAIAPPGKHSSDKLSLVWRSQPCLVF